MTVSALNVSDGPYVGNGATTAFPFTFDAGSTSEVSVTLDGAEQAVGFTVTLNAGGNGGTVTFATAPASGVEVIPFLDPNFAQDINFTDSGPFLPTTLTEALDRAARRAIYLNGLLSRTVLSALGTSGVVASAVDEGGVIGVSAGGGLAILPPGNFIGPSGTMVASGLLFVTPQQFGGNADYDGTTVITDSGPAFLAAIAYLESLSIPAIVNPTIYRGGPTLYVPAGWYYSSETLAPKTTIRIIGDGGLGWGAPTRISFPAGIDGVRVQAHNTSGATDFDAVAHYAGDRLHIQDIYFRGAYNWGAPNEGEFMGIRVKRPVSLLRCTFDNFQGDGFYCVASVGAGSPNEGNANMAHATQCDFTGNRVGRYVRGSDANAMSFRDCQYNDNRKRGIDDFSFIGNNEYSPHASGNGIAAGQPMPTLVSYLGNRFTPIDGQEAGASVNAPPGTATNNTWWRFAYAGGVAGTVVPAWVNGITVRSGGAYAGTGWFWGAYEEGGQGSTIVDTPGGVYQGNTTNKGSGAWVRTDASFHRMGSGDGASGFVADGYSSVNGRFDVNGELIEFNGAGPKFQFRNAGVAGGYILSSGGTLYLNGPGAGGLSFRVADTDIAKVGATELFPGADDTYNLGVSAAALRWKTVFAMKGNFATDITVAGNKVIGGRDTGWTADTGTSKKTATATYAVGSALTVGAAYVQAEVTAIITRQALIEAALRDATQEIKALKDALIAHGLLGA